MPLKICDAPPEPLQDVKANYIVFYSSIDQSGEMWCPDCRNVEQLVSDAFMPEDAPTALIVYVGQKAEWKGVRDNPYKQEPWNLHCIPTIIRLKDGERLQTDEKEEISQLSLSAFIKT